MPHPERGAEALIGGDDGMIDPAQRARRERRRPMT